MKFLPLLLLAAAGGAVFVALEHHASAASPSVWPPGFTPPGTSTTTVVPPGAGNPTGLAIKITKWQQAADASGQQAGTWSLAQNNANQANDWAVFFSNGTGSPQLVQQGTTAKSGLLAQALQAGLVE